MKKKILILLLLCFLLVGCGKRVESGTDVSSKSDTDGTSGNLICSRVGNISGNASTVLSYDIKYRNGYITTLHSIEKVQSTDSAILDQYEAAYRKIFKAYEDLKYYTNTVTRTNTEVSSDTLIEYNRVNMDELKRIENSEQSIIRNGKVSLKDWLELAEKLGTRCTEK